MREWANEAYGRVIEKYKKSAELARRQGLIPYQAAPGAWKGAPYDGNSWWTGGFWPGLMWQLYCGSEDPVFAEEAVRVEKMLTNEFMTFEFLNHDVGFMYLLSCGARYRLRKEADARRNLLHAATILAGRFNPAGFICAWNRNRPGWAIIDCMMNLSLLYWASEETGDPRFRAIAMRHADTTLREFVREDGSCNHIVIFDAETGQALEAPGGQGYGAGSSWSRGQAWGLYGFTISYRYTGEKRYLDTALRIARYFVANIRADGLTDCDFRQPKGEERIDNIAGACAACGLMELAECGIAPREAAQFRSAAEHMIRALGETCADWSDQTPGILTKCTASYHDDGAGRHVNMVYGDYFFVEALMRLRGTDARLWFSMKEASN